MKWKEFFMLQKNISYHVICLILLISLKITFPVSIFAAGVEAVLSDSSGVTGFEVRNSGTVTIIMAKSDGKVGIGTSTPSSVLHVEGTSTVSTALKITGTLTVTNGNVGIGTTTPATSLQITNDSGTTNGLTIGGDLGLGTSVPLQVVHTNTNIFLERRNSDATLSPDISLIKTNGTFGTPANVIDNDSLGGISFRGFEGSTARSIAASISAFVDGTPGTGDMPGRLVFSTRPDNDGDSSPDERMRITSTGNLGIGTSTPGNKLSVQEGTATTSIAFFSNLGSTAPQGIQIKLGATTIESDDVFIKFLDGNGTTVGSISGTSTPNGVSYNTISDARLKENIRNTHYGLKELISLPVRDYNFIGSSADTSGFIAQELYDVYPIAVSVGGEDPHEKPWGVDYGKLTPLIVKSIQEQQLQIEELKNVNIALNAENIELKNLISRIEKHYSELKTEFSMFQNLVTKQNPILAKKTTDIQIRE